MIDRYQNMSDNNSIEKYCYNDIENSCTIYGGLYYWDEAMQYVTDNGVQGICLPGWHIPSDEEWKILEGTVDSQYGIGDPEWDDTGFRGSDANQNLKSTSGWFDSENGTDLYGFTALPSGYRKHEDGSFFGLTWNSTFWSSTEIVGSGSFARYIDYIIVGVDRGNSDTEVGRSLRCLKDD